MKILLPKTLAEPLTIPWPTLLPASELVAYIKKDLEDFYRYLDMKGITPKPLGVSFPENTMFSRDEVQQLLKGNALRNGADTAFCGVWNMRRMDDSTKILEYRYLVQYTVPGTTRIYRVTLGSDLT